MLIHRTVLVAIVALAMVSSAGAAGMKQVGTIQIPGDPMTDLGVMAIDQNTGLGYIGDKAAKAVVVFDTKTDKFVTRIDGGFVGLQKNSSVSGPNGSAVVNNGAELWISDGDSTIKIIDLKTNKVVETISTGGKLRANGMSYGANANAVIVANSNDDPPYLSVISTAPGRKIIAKIPIPQSGANLERSAFHVPSGMFYTAIPESADKTKGLMAQVEAKSGELVKLHELDCHPHSLSVVSDTTIFLGCSSQHGANPKPGGDMAIFDIPSGKIEGYKRDYGGNGGSTANVKLGQYYHSTTAGELVVVDIKSRELVQKIKTSNGARTSSVNLSTNKLYVASTNRNAACPGCITVYAPE